VNTPLTRQDVLEVVLEALELHDTKKADAHTKRIVAEYEEPSYFGLQDEKTEKKGKD
jgi:hypothetical protein